MSEIQLSPFESLLVEYGPDPAFPIDRYVDLSRRYGHAAALTIAAKHYQTRLCEVRELHRSDESTIPWIDDGEDPVRRGEPIGRVIGNVRYVGSRRQCAAFLRGEEPGPTWLEWMDL